MAEFFSKQQIENEGGVHLPGNAAKAGTVLGYIGGIGIAAEALGIPLFKNGLFGGLGNNTAEAVALTKGARCHGQGKTAEEQLLVLETEIKINNAVNSAIAPINQSIAITNARVEKQATEIAVDRAVYGAAEFYKAKLAEKDNLITASSIKAVYDYVDCYAVKNIKVAPQAPAMAYPQNVVVPYPQFDVARVSSRVVEGRREVPRQFSDCECD